MVSHKLNVRELRQQDYGKLVYDVANAIYRKETSFLLAESDLSSNQILLKPAAPYGESHTVYKDEAYIEQQHALEVVRDTLAAIGIKPNVDDIAYSKESLTPSLSYLPPHDMLVKMELRALAQQYGVALDNGPRR